MIKTRLTATLLILLGLLTGWFVYNTEIHDSRFNFKLGLDLDGGTHLTYIADVSGIEDSDVEGAMDSLRKTVEKRINLFGVSEPIVQVEKGGIFSEEGNNNRLIIELPGVTDVEEAIDMIGRTPILEFRLMTKDPEVLASVLDIVDPEEYSLIEDQIYLPTGLTGAQLKRSTLGFDPTSGQPLVNTEFNDEGTELLKTITQDNIGNVMAIYLDGVPISTPVLRDVIFNGQAQISGDFTPEEAKALVQDLNFGALPLPIELAETQTIGSTLGEETLNKGVSAFVWGLSIIFIFLIIIYRVPGAIATISLIAYVVIMLALFKLIPVVLTASGLAGFILSIGMAVDANVLIFERLKEELKEGLSVYDAVKESSKKAWSSIRDGNLSSLISAFVLFWMSGTSLVKGFALVFGIGVLVSMFTAVVISRTLLLAIASRNKESKLKVMFGK